MCHRERGGIGGSLSAPPRGWWIDCGGGVMQNAGACRFYHGGEDVELDLGAHNVTNLEIACDAGLSKQEFDQVKASLPENALSEGRLVRHCDYRIGRRRYHELAILGPAGEGKYWLAIHASSGGGTGATAGSVEDLLQALSGLSRTAALNCAVDFRYPWGRWSSSVSLPLRLPQWGQAFDEVRGIRLVKISAGKEVEYSAILDRPRSREYFLSLTFAYQSTIDPSMPQRVVLEASRISGLLIKPKGSR